MLVDSTNIWDTFAKMNWESLDISSQNGLVKLTCFGPKMFSCIIAKRVDFRSLGMS